MGVASCGQGARGCVGTRGRVVQLGTAEIDLVETRRNENLAGRQ